MTPRTTRSEKLDLRLTGEAKQMLQEAAAVAQKTVSEFVLESALSEARERLSDRRVFILDEERWVALRAALDAPPRRQPRLEKLFSEPSFFDPNRE
ncbi:DUF1778 domain-containing protein [Methylocystis parvus]|uniref:DUF1778 domain-containing protein n=1 Tax=Methylocystis parvus TaxID=134 RepID=A0A6B8MGD0_9HYPH|nr:DUF1778 domain-containing protein [Methylocystis parvus]